MPMLQASQAGSDVPFASLQGEWWDEDGALVTVRGAMVCGPDGSELGLVAEGDNSFCLLVGCERYRGRLEGEHLAWSDGASWRRPSTVQADQKHAEEGIAAAVVADAGQPREDQRIQVAVRHAIDGHELRVSLPRRAKFRHLREAVGRHLDSNEFLVNGRLMKKERGMYRALKEEDLIDDVRQVLVARVDLEGACGGPELCVGSSEVSEEEEPTRAARAPPRAIAAQRAPAAAGGPLTRKRALALQRELLEGFQDSTFLARLASLEVLRGTETARFAQERQELMLSVHCAVLPRYGFEGSPKGVYKMLGECGPFLKDPEFRKLTLEMNDLLGIDLPPETWERRVESCKGLAGAGGEPKAARPTGAAGTAAAASSCLATAGRRFLGAAPRSGPEVESAPGPGDGASWPPGKTPPFKLFIAGSWSNYAPEEMAWQAGLFLYPMRVSRQGRDSFQLLVNGDWAAAVYPSIRDATPFEEHAVLGPDGRGHGKNWQIGKRGIQQAHPGTPLVVIAVLGADGRVSLVQWQEAGAG